MRDVEAYADGHTGRSDLEGIGLRASWFATAVSVGGEHRKLLIASTLYPAPFSKHQQKPLFHTMDLYNLVFLFSFKEFSAWFLFSLT